MVYAVNLQQYIAEMSGPSIFLFRVVSKNGYLFIHPTRWNFWNSWLNYCVPTVSLSPRKKKTSMKPHIYP